MTLSPFVKNHCHSHSLYVCKEPATVLGGTQTTLLRSGVGGLGPSITPCVLHLQENILNDSKGCFVSSCTKARQPWAKSCSRTCLQRAELRAVAYLSLSIPQPPSSQVCGLPAQAGAEGRGRHSCICPKPLPWPCPCPQPEVEGGWGTRSFKAQWPRPRSSESSDCS